MELDSRLMLRVVRVLVCAVAMMVSAPAVAQEPAAEYTVGPRDILTVTVWSQPDVSGKYTVGANGTFTFPLIGEVKAAGLTLSQLEGELRKRLSDGFFVQPQVSIEMGEYRSRRIFVVGEVRQPGSYPLTGAMTLIEAIAKAGSTTADAAPEVLIVRAAGGQRSGPVLPEYAGSADVRRVNLNDLQSGAAVQAQTLDDGDTVFVPRAERIFVAGQVRTPGAYPIGSETTVLQVLTLAGGVTERAATNRIKVIRITASGAKQETRVKLGDIVQAGDTLVVPERFF